MCFSFLMPWNICLVIPKTILLLCSPIWYVFYTYLIHVFHLSDL